MLPALKELVIMWRFDMIEIGWKQGDSIQCDLCCCQGNAEGGEGAGCLENLLNGITFRLKGCD